MKNKLIAVIVLIAGFYSLGSYSQVNTIKEEAAGNNSLKFNSSNSGNIYFAQFKDGLSNSAKENLFAQVKSDLKSSIGRLTNSKLISFLILKDSTNPEQVGTNTQKEKSVWLGIALSAVLPGAGEFYGKSYLKAAIFFAVEAGLWGTYYYFQHTGNIKTNDFQNYANKYWNIRWYAQWLISGGFQSTGQINPNEPNLETLRQEILVCEKDPQNPFSHELPDFGQQQFYELIGKYQEFEAGWDNQNPNFGPLGVLQHHLDYALGSPYSWQTYHDPVWNNYAYNRQDANNFYNHGTTTAMIIIINHIASIADAAWTISMFNKSLHFQTGVRLDTYIDKYTYETKTQPTFNLQVNF